MKNIIKVMILSALVLFGMSSVFSAGVNDLDKVEQYYAYSGTGVTTGFPDNIFTFDFGMNISSISGLGVDDNVTMVLYGVNFETETLLGEEVWSPYTPDGLFEDTFDVTYNSDPYTSFLVKVYESDDLGGNKRFLAEFDAEANYTYSAPNNDFILDGSLTYSEGSNKVTYTQGSDFNCGGFSGYNCLVRLDVYLDTVFEGSDSMTISAGDLFIVTEVTPTFDGYGNYTFVLNVEQTSGESLNDTEDARGYLSYVREILIDPTPFFIDNLTASLDVDTGVITYSYSGSTEFTSISVVEELLKEVNASFVQEDTNTAQSNSGNLTYSTNATFTLLEDATYKVKVTLVADGNSVYQETEAFAYEEVVYINANDNNRGGGGISLSVTTTTPSEPTLQEPKWNLFSWFGGLLSNLWTSFVSIF